MKAIVFDRHGPPEVLVEREIPDPQVSGSDVLVEVRAAGVNHLDIFLRRGLPGLRMKLPHVIGADAAGVVRAKGPEAGPEPEIGARVVVNPGISCGHCEFCGAGFGGACRTFRIIGEHVDGSYAQLLKVPSANLMMLPAEIGFEDAAAAPLVFVTAWSMLITKGHLSPGEDVLVLAAGSGVGTASIQIARLAGCRVFAAAGSDDKLAHARELGAEILINYKREEFDRVVREQTGGRGVDVVVDHVGADTWVRSLRAARKGGRILTCGATSGYAPTTDLRHVFYRQLQVIGSTMGSAADFANVMRQVLAGRLRPVVDSILPLEHAAEAHRRIEARNVFGKIILRP
jgi:NADPH:quinone reductase-like Zn-dependent oxidoreductase